MLGFVGVVTRLPARLALHISINVFYDFLLGLRHGHDACTQKLNYRQFCRRDGDLDEFGGICAMYEHSNGHWHADLWTSIHGNRSNGRSCLRLIRGRPRQHPYGLSDPAGQRFRLGARRSQIGPARWRRVGSRRRRRSDQQVLLGHDRQSERRHIQPYPGHRGDLQLRRLGAADRWRTQVGQDISRLNWGGWNVHVGITAGYLASRSTDNSGGSTNFEAPFFGGYAVATHGWFFADVMAREEFYNANLTNFSVGLFNQQVGARGASVSTSAGYNFALANNWFIEPSAGFIRSRTNVDTFSLSGGVPGNGIACT
jgi:hypothetical protein